MSGGGGGTVDKGYNAGILKIAQQQQGMSDEQYNIYKYGTLTDPTKSTGGPFVDPLTGQIMAGRPTDANYDPDDYYTGMEYEQDALRAKGDTLAGDTAAQIAESSFNAADFGARESLLAGQTERTGAENILGTETARSNLSLLPGATERTAAENRLGTETAGYESGALEGRYANEALGLETENVSNRSKQEQIRARMPVMREFYKQALTGVDVNERVREAGKDTARSFADTDAANRRNMARLGVNPRSGRFADASRASNMAKVAAISSARYGARRNAEDDKFRRLTTATSTAIGG